MSWYAVAVGGSALVGYIGSQQAAKTQSSAAQQATDATMAQFNQLQANQAPYIQAGQTAIGQMGRLMQPGSAFMTPFTNADLNSYLAPNYQFQLQQGLGQAQNAANVVGGMGGNTLQGLNTFAQNFAQNAYQNAFQNYQTSQGNIWNRLASIATGGQQANQTNAYTGVNMTGQAINLLTSGAAAQAAGQVGAANAIGGGLNTWGSMQYLQNLMNQNQNPTAGGGIWPG